MISEVAAEWSFFIVTYGIYYSMSDSEVMTANLKDILNGPQYVFHEPGGCIHRIIPEGVDILKDHSIGEPVELHYNGMKDGKHMWLINGEPYKQVGGICL